MDKFLVLDTETAGGLGNPLAYDVGGVVVDSTGYIHERFHWVCLEIIGNPAIMSTAFYAEKMPIYWQEVAKGTIKPLAFADILRKITALCDFHDIKAIPAYNMAFDNRALSNTCEHIFNNKKWLNRDIPLWCIWSAACESVLNTEKFIKWAVKNNLISEKGNPRTNAEICFRYITGNGKFQEEHTGGRDAEIEAAILSAILRRKSQPSFAIKGMPWRTPAKKYREMLAAGKFGQIETAIHELNPDYWPGMETPPEDGPHHYTDARHLNRID